MADKDLKRALDALIAIKEYVIAIEDVVADEILEDIRADIPFVVRKIYSEISLVRTELEGLMGN